MSSSLPNIDWREIRPLDGSREAGFEEMCTQLARLAAPPDSLFERKGTPDAGVECYAVLPSGREWGWQAKYFAGVGTSQWSQLDASIKTALEKHPKLEKYFVCIPLDRPDARVKGYKSVKERWDERVKKWKRWANGRGVMVDFIWIGSHELIQQLSRTQNAGLVRFWFDKSTFDPVWFQARFEEARKTAGPRYTPEIHVDLPIAQEFEALGRTQLFFDNQKAQAKELRKKLSHFVYERSDPPDPGLDTLTSALRTQVDSILTDLGAIRYLPSTPLPFREIADKLKSAESSAEEITKLISKRERDYSQQPLAAGVPSRGHGNPFTSQRYRLYELMAEFRKIGESLLHAATVASNPLMILRGNPGTGKTHLLCDVARHRLESGRPTVLLMGQRFISAEGPWVQALQQLDLAKITAGEFVGALEAASQAADCRALVLIDALNEGNGRQIWPTNLAAFLTQLERSAWVSVVLSIRTSYEDVVVPDQIRERAYGATHYGFTDHEYSALKTFFQHYELELPSTPLLSPEFNNPLFLKTLCVGLRESGEHRLPRGSQGVTTVFNLYLASVNKRLASSLDYNPKQNLAEKAMQALANAFIGEDKRWMNHTDGANLVDKYLPNRDFSRSLYRGLIDEGLLVEDIITSSHGSPQEIVFIAYDRLADYIVATAMLDAHLGTGNPSKAFSSKGPFAFLWDKSRYPSPGLLEALCVQIPERTGKELVKLAPKVLNNRHIGSAFRQSIIWRNNNAFSKDTKSVLSALIRSDADLTDTVDVLLTVATLPGHPLNATYLNDVLLRYEMPDRDAWWSICLHRSYGEHNAVDRIIDWASTIAPNAYVDNDAVDLCAIALGWMLTTSNRFLRDRATKGLVSLLTNRYKSANAMLSLFADVDDLYVVERVLAVAYGIAMRSNDPQGVAELAQNVYRRVFESAQPRPHILLRDYARGIVERALALNAPMQVDSKLIRPPYRSAWPKIPSTRELSPYLPDWSRGSHDSGEPFWSFNRIGSSVMDDDFARYVIGTNSSSNWLSVRLQAKPWKSPNDLLKDIVASFSQEEQAAWENFEKSDAEVSRLSFPKMFLAFRGSVEAREIADGSPLSTKQMNEEEDEDDPKLEVAKQEREDALHKLESLLSDKRRRNLRSILEKKTKSDSVPPKFDLRLIQRYVLRRVFDLGWTVKRFGQFDRFSAGFHGREASKVERIGKKYQWIAYHEILALVADHFQYRDDFGNDRGDREYHGPWQDYIRDIDPSCTLRSTPGGTSWGGHSPAWWGTATYKSWGDPEDSNGWLLAYDDLPAIEQIIKIEDPRDGSRWLNTDGYFNWKEAAPPDRESSEVDRRELWYSLTAYLIRSEDLDPFLMWAEGVDFWGRWMPNPPDSYKLFLGEYGWSPASKYFSQPYFGDDGWVEPRQDCPVRIRTATFEYRQESSGFDCSIDEGFTLRLPVVDLVEYLGLRWNGHGADYTDSAGTLVAFDPTAHEVGPSALLLREDTLMCSLQSEGLTLCWALLGEKRILDAGLTPRRRVTMRLSGAYGMKNTGLQGFLKCIADDVGASNPKVIGTLRSPRKS